jgi:RNA polymerase sigma-70 factor (ECF subfamily)
MKNAAARTIDGSIPRRPAPEGLRDAEILSRVGQGDLSSLGALYDRHHESVHRFLARATGSEADAEDLVHETFLALVRAAPRYDGRESARPLLLGIASKLILSRRRTLARAARVLRELAGGARDRSSPSPEGIASAAEELRRFDRALMRLTEEKRVVVLMVDAEGLSGEEVARSLEIPLGTVWTRLHYGRAELRRALPR